VRAETRPVDDCLDCHRFRNIVGGVTSPLLANIALHGLETFNRRRFPEWKGQRKGEYQASPNVIRYADDFVVLHEKRDVVEACQQLISE
jgi:RNA-directed DNA polymerase